MPNWCSNYLEIESEQFIKDSKESLNHDKIGLMMFLILKLPDVMGHDKEKIHTIIQNFGEKAATPENMEQLESFFHDFFPNEILDSDSAIQAYIDQAHKNRFGKKLTPNEVRKIIQSPNIITHEVMEFSLFNFTTRPMKLFLGEQFQFSLTDEEEKIIEADVISSNNETIGTKWDASVNDIDIIDNTAFIRFNTAWSPPIPAIQNMADKYPDAKIKLVYAEQGCAYCGQIEFEGGDEVMDLQSDFSFMEPEDMSEEECDDAFDNIDNWSFDDGVEIHLLNGNHGG